jgi:hypothetical protein
VSGGNVIDDWGAVSATPVQWIGYGDFSLFPAADQQRFLDLSAGSGSNAPILGAVFQTANYFQTGQSSPVLRRYRLALDIGVGAPPDHASTVRVNVHVITLGLQKIVIYTEPDPPASGVKWRRFSFCFEIPAGYVVPGTNHSLEIRALPGTGFKGVDNVTLHALS